MRAAAAGKAYISPIRSSGPFTYQCSSGQTARGTLRAAFYNTEPPMVLVDREGVARPAFQVRAASGVRYEGNDVLFWEARGEVSVSWSGVELTCKQG
jgi:membrane-bound inhibitor of C-type lysozyme